ncbi:MAG: hypothetical protein II388_09850 [Clostridia bacterium]|nr:hypothetical protein [Clostridia bacterium]
MKGETMLKARIWIIDDKDPEKDEVYENFEMLPTEKWEEGTFLDQIENYKFTFVFTKLKSNRKE